jgi:hypothetical protein
MLRRQKCCASSSNAHGQTGPRRRPGPRPVRIDRAFGLIAARLLDHACDVGWVHAEYLAAARVRIRSKNSTATPNQPSANRSQPWPRADSSPRHATSCSSAHPAPGSPNLATSPGIAAAHHGHGVLFATAADWVTTDAPPRRHTSSHRTPSHPPRHLRISRRPQHEDPRLHRRLERLNRPGSGPRPPTKSSPEPNAPQLQLQAARNRRTGSPVFERRIDAIPSVADSGSRRRPLAA